MAKYKNNNGQKVYSYVDFLPDKDEETEYYILYDVDYYGDIEILNYSFINSAGEEETIALSEQDRMKLIELIYDNCY